jgi:hypothetical protein
VSAPVEGWQSGSSPRHYQLGFLVSCHIGDRVARIIESSLKDWEKQNSNSSNDEVRYSR